MSLTESHPKSRAAELETLRRRCREHGLRLTIQRRAVLEALVDLPGHPAAEALYSIVSGRLPGISRTTIYRTLDQLVRVGVIGRACHPGNTVRYDGRTDLHHHLVCLGCESIVDISDPDLDRLPIPDTAGLGFEVQQFQVQFRGFCRACRDQRRKEATT
jgi:Fur family transcriptional regulator, peroxide stress response regulator